MILDPASNVAITGGAGATMVKSLQVGGGAGSVELQLQSGSTLTAAGGISVDANGTLDGAGDPSSRAFGIELHDPRGADLADSTALVTVDYRPLPGLFVEDALANENAGSIRFNVRLSAPAPTDVSFRWHLALQDQGSTLDAAPEDLYWYHYYDLLGQGYGYDPATGNSEPPDLFGTFLVHAGSSTAQLSLPLVSDYFFERDERFTLVLSDARGATLESRQAQGTIRDTTPEPTVYLIPKSNNPAAPFAAPEGPIDPIAYFSGLTGWPSYRFGTFLRGYVGWPFFAANARGNSLEFQAVLSWPTDHDIQVNWNLAGVQYFDQELVPQQSGTLLIPAGHLAAPARVASTPLPSGYGVWRTFASVVASDSLLSSRQILGTSLVLSSEPRAVAVALSSGSVSTFGPSAASNDATYVCVNDDDDNSNSRPDDSEGSDGVAGEDDLVPVHLAADIDELIEGLVCHSYIDISWAGTGSIRLWRNANRSGESVPFDRNFFFYHAGRPTQGLGIPDTLYVEGISPGHGTLSLLAYIDDVLVGYDQVEIDVEECTPQINLQAYTITSDPQTGYNHWVPGRFLQKEKEDNPGAFLPLNDDDDDYNARPANLDVGEIGDPGIDWEQAGPVLGEDDFLPIHISRPNPSDLEGRLFLEFPGAMFRVWTSNEPGADQISPNEELDVPANGLDLFVEGLKPGVGTMTLKWDSPDDNRDCQDTLRLTVFQWKGALNTPGHSLQKYTAEGIDAEEGKWLTPTESEGHVVSKRDFPNDDAADIRWGSGPFIGHSILHAGASYDWALGVNVVEVQFALGIPIEYSSTFGYTDNGDFETGTGVDSNGNRIPGMQAHVVMTTLRGAGSDYSRGVDFIQVGFVQTLDVALWQEFHASADLDYIRFSRRTSEGSTFLDFNVDTELPPWGNTHEGEWYQDDFTEPSYEEATTALTFQDSPSIGFYPSYVSVPGLAGQHASLVSVSALWKFRTYLCVDTDDPTDLGEPADDITVRASFDWLFQVNTLLLPLHREQGDFGTDERGEDSVNVSGDEYFHEHEVNTSFTKANYPDTPAILALLNSQFVEDALP